MSDTLTCYINAETGQQVVERNPKGLLFLAEGIDEFLDHIRKNLDDQRLLANQDD